MLIKVFLLLLMLFFANLAWVSNKWLGLYGAVHHLWQRFAELLVAYFIMIGVAILVERNVMGQVWPQGWEFYSITLALFIVLSFPGFIYRMLWK